MIGLDVQYTQKGKLCENPVIYKPDAPTHPRQKDLLNCSDAAARGQVVHGRCSSKAGTSSSYCLVRRASYVKLVSRRCSSFRGCRTGSAHISQRLAVASCMGTGRLYKNKLRTAELIFRGADKRTGPDKGNCFDMSQAEAAQFHEHRAAAF